MSFFRATWYLYKVLGFSGSSVTAGDQCLVSRSPQGKQSSHDTKTFRDEKTCERPSSSCPPRPVCVARCMVGVSGEGRGKVWLSLKVRRTSSPQPWECVRTTPTSPPWGPGGGLRSGLQVEVLLAALITLALHSDPGSCSQGTLVLGLPSPQATCDGRKHSHC